MVNMKNTVTTKVIALLLSIAMLIGLVPVGTAPVSALPAELMGTLSCFTEGGTLTGETGAEAKAEFANVSLEWSAADAVAGRNQDGWWVGVKMTAPASLQTEADFAGVTYQNKANGTWSEAKSFWEKKDSAGKDTIHYIGLWGLVNEQHLNDAIANSTTVDFVWQFNWDADAENVYEQVVTVSVDPESIILNKDGAQVYPAAADTGAAVTSLSSGLTVTGSGTNVVQAALESNVELTWVEKNDVRTQDGWWLGVNAVAPAGVDLTKVKYQNKTASGWGTAKDFAQFRDTENSIQLWGLLNAEYLKNAVANSKTVNYQWRFDWDGNGSYEQIITFAIDPAKVILNDERGNQVFPALTDPQLKFGSTVSQVYLYTKNDKNVYDFSASSLSSAEIAYSSSDAAVAAVDEKGKVTVKAAGEVTITAYIPDDGSFASQEISATLTVKEDTTVPVIETLKFSEDLTEDDNFVVTDDEKMTVTVTAADDETGIAECLFSTDAGKNYQAAAETDGKWQFEISKEFRNSLLVKAVNGAGKSAETNADGKIIVVDTITPEVTASYTLAENSTYYDTQTELFTNDQITVNFVTSDANMDISGKPAVLVNGKAWDAVAWDQETGEGSFELSDEGSYTYQISYKDIAGHEKVAASAKTLSIDKTAPVVTGFTSTTEEWTKENVTISGNVTDTMAGVAKVEYKIGTDENAAWNSLAFEADGAFSLTVKEECDTEYTFRFIDNVGNAAEEKSVKVKIDKTAPDTFNIEYKDVTIWKRIGSFFGFMDDSVDVVVSAEDALSGVKIFEVSTNSGSSYEKAELKEGEHSFTLDPQYRDSVRLKATDQAGNEAEYIKEKDDEYTLVIDAITPELNATYQYKGAHQTVGDIIYTNGNVDVTFTLKADNFDLSEKPVVTVNGDKAEVQWDSSDENLIHTATLPLTVEKDSETDYVVEVSFVDQLDRAQTYKQKFHLDTKAPEIKDYTFTPGQVKDTKDGRAYYDAAQTVTIQVDEHNFDASKVELTVEAVDAAGNPVDVSKYNYTEEAAKKDNWSSSGDLHTLNLKFEADANYTLKLKVTDYATNSTTADDSLFTVDTKAPENVAISYSDPVIDLWQNILKTITFGAYNPEKNAPLTVTLSADDVTAGVEYFEWTYTKEAGASNVNAESSAAPVKIVPAAQEYSNGGKTATVKFEVPAQARGYISFRAVDRSTNGKAERTNDTWKEDSDRINIVDTTAPIVSVVYDENTPVSVENGISYYRVDRTATIQIKEANFYAEDVKLLVTAKQSNGTDIAVDSYAAYAMAAENWTQEGDVYTLNTDGMLFDVEANYTFDIEYTDRSGNAAVYKKSLEDGETAADYAQDLFTIDRTAPSLKSIVYKDTTDGSVEGTLYYGERVEVIMTVEDVVAGVHSFTYNYKVAENVSGVNKGMEKEETIQAADIKQDGNSFTASFFIPKEAVLEGNNQFNGTISFTAEDRAANVGGPFDGKNTVVVDNLIPQRDVTVNDPVKIVDGVSYYAGDIETTIVINEANFFEEDVVFTVTKDETAYPVNVTWTHNGTDEHIGKFTLTDDGDYKVTITYADRSKNVMAMYESVPMTIDTKDPVIRVSDVKHQSANNAETISFTVSVTDTNIEQSNFRPVLNAVVKKENGANSFTYEKVDIALGNPVTSTVNGETVYTYTVSNLEVDGFYSLVCTAVDNANHSVSIINSAANEGGNTTVDTMNFSVNRGGSVFWIETEHTDKYTGETFTDALNGAYANDQVIIKLHEINVDKVDEEGQKKTIFSLNDGSQSQDIELVEGVNYSKNVSVGAGGWYETVYTLDNGTFDHDGVYSFNVITYDKASNSNVNTKMEAGTISFTLDRTVPVISANVKSDLRVRDSEFWVEFEITETNLDAQTLEVKVWDRKGNPVEVAVEDLGNNQYKFLVSSGLNYDIEIVAKDLAGHESEVYQVDNFTVSTNFLILWYANTPLFWGSIGAAVLVAGMIIFLIILKKKKKEKEEANI